MCQMFYGQNIIFFFFQIKIRIIDLNNKIPQYGVFDTVVEFYENITTGHLIQTLATSDMDRDGKAVNMCT